MPLDQPCEIGVTSCSSGSLACTPIATAADGAPCGPSSVCLAGRCGSCVAGAPCTPNGNACQTGVTSCATGQATCVATGDAPDETSCASGICCEGQCAACGGVRANSESVCTGATCSTACSPGFTACGISCVDTTNDTTACGPSCAGCPPGSTCLDSACVAVDPGCDAACATSGTCDGSEPCTSTGTTAYGFPTAFSPCESSAGAFDDDTLFLQRVTIAGALTVTALGEYLEQPSPSAEGAMALYADADGAPGRLVAFTDPAALVLGKNQFPVVSPTVLPAGESWWIGSEFSLQTQGCNDASTSNQILYVSAPFGTFPDPLSEPDGAAPQVIELIVDLGFYVLGTQ